MVVFNSLKREIDIKIVYYGPALCGKTTNIQSVYKILNPKQRGELVSLSTKDDRTLFFDFLPIELDSIKGFKTRFHIYTVPGQVLYTLTRRAVLTGVDGIIFVADSQIDKMDENIESMNDLKENLKYYNKDLESIPFVIQYNKRDLENIFPLEKLESEINALQVPSFDAIAVDDRGVMETLTMCCRMVLRRIREKSITKKFTEGKERDKEREVKKIQEAIEELPKLKLVESSEREDELNIQQPQPEGQLEQDTKPLQQLEEVSLPGLRDDETFEQAEKGKEQEEEPTLANDLSKEDKGMKLIKSEAFVGGAQVGFQDEVIRAEQGVEEDISKDGRSKGKSITKKDKRSCPRCSLEFKTNIKQCPICKISLISEGQEEETEVQQDETVTLPEAELIEETAEKKEIIKIADIMKDKKGLEIVACGIPKRTSSTAIRIPLIMKIDKTNQEFKVNLAINFEDFILK